MIQRMTGTLDLAQRAARAHSRLVHRGEKRFRADRPGARGLHQRSPRLEHAQRQACEAAIRRQGLRHLHLFPGKRRRVDDHQVKAATALPQPCQCLERVLGQQLVSRRRDRRLIPVQRQVASRGC